MAAETNEGGNKTPETGGAVSPGGAPTCGPGCGCVKAAGSGGTQFKIAVCLVVVIAASGIILYKMTSARNNAADCGRPGFVNFLATTPTAGPSSERPQSGIVSSVPSMGAIDTVAATMDTVLLLIPTKDNAPATKATSAAVAAVERTLKVKGVRIGVFTLQTDSPDYPNVAAKLLSVPGIVVLTKGRGNSAVSGEMSEEILMQAYVASTQRGSCCPPGGAPCK